MAHEPAGSASSPLTVQDLLAKYEPLTAVSIDVDRASKAAEAIRAPELTDVAAAFASNIRNAAGLFDLYRHGASYGLDLASRAGKADKDTQWMEPLATLLGLASGKMMAASLHNDEFREKFRTLLLAMTTLSWTAFEVVASDSWEAAVNARPTLLAERVMAGFDKDQQPAGLGARSIAVWMAAKYGFDLRATMGTILASRIDFSNRDDTSKAFRTAFQDDGLTAVLSSPDLNELRASRHLIVHRAGRVDQDYRDNTRLSVPDGTPLQLDGPKVSRLANAAVTAGCAVLQMVDDWLTRNPVS